MPEGRLDREQWNSRHTSITTNGPSGSGFSTVQDESSVTSAPDVAGPQFPKFSKRMKRRSDRRRIAQARLRKQPQNGHQRYWNELDNGSEGDEDEAYTILVYPHKSLQSSGATAISDLFTSMVGPFRKVAQKSVSWFRARQGQHESLIKRKPSPDAEDSDQSDEERALLSVNPAPHQHYSTFSKSSDLHAVRARESLLLSSCITSFGASLILLAVAAILKFTGRRKAGTTVDAGVIVGVVTSILFAIIAVVSMIGRKDEVGWVHRSSVLLLFIFLVICGAALLASLI